MYDRWFMAVVVAGLMHGVSGAAASPSVPFVDGLWRGDVKTAAGGEEFEECWAATTFADGTTLSLAERKDGTWHLRLSNASWRLPHPHRYDMVALVDFYSRLHLAADTKSRTLLEIADLDHIHLLGLIENGHTIDLAADRFSEKYVLEGSAKVIERIRNCFAER